MNITVAICTWNRAQLLSATLLSLESAIAAAQSNVEVLVVDNNCTDGTATLLKSLASRIPIRHISEPEPGLSNARNAAVRSARGDYILWTDDDVLIEPGWIAAYESAIQRHPEAAFFGGPIRTLLEGRPPNWLRRSLAQIDYIFSAIDLGAAEFPIVRTRDLPYGANFAVRTREQKSILYDPVLGRQPDMYWLAGEESRALKTLLENGARGWWIPAAHIGHRITRDRQSLAYLAMHGVGQGMTYQRLSQEDGNGARVLGRSLGMWRQTVMAAGRCIASIARRSPDVWVPELHRACVAVGRLREYRGRPDR